MFCLAGTAVQNTLLSIGHVHKGVFEFQVADTRVAAA